MKIHLDFSYEKISLNGISEWIKILWFVWNHDYYQVYVNHNLFHSYFANNFIALEISNKIQRDNKINQLLLLLLLRNYVRRKFANTIPVENFPK